MCERIITQTLFPNFLTGYLLLRSINAQQYRRYSQLCTLSSVEKDRFNRTVITTQCAFHSTANRLLYNLLARFLPWYCLCVFVCMCNNLTCIWTNSRGKRCSHAANLSLSFASSRPLYGLSNFAFFRSSWFFNFNFFLSFDCRLRKADFFLFLFYFNKVSILEKIKEFYFLIE